MTTLAALQTRIRDNVYGQHPTDMPFTATLGAAIATTATTTVTVADGTFWAIGDVLEVQETGEQTLVTAVATNDLTVVRGFNGTTAATAVDAGLIVKNPRFSLRQIENAVNTTMLSLEAWGIHAFATSSIIAVTLQDFYELSLTSLSEQYGLLSVYYVNENTYVPQPLPFRPAYFNLGTDPSEYSVGTGVHILAWGNVVPGESVYVTYAKKLDDVADLTTRTAELVVIGATAVLLGMTIAPATHEPGARTDRTVQPGQTSRDVRHWQGEFYIRARAEAAQIAVQRRNLPSTVRLARARRWRQ